MGLKYFALSKVMRVAALMLAAGAAFGAQLDRQFPSANCEGVAISIPATTSIQQGVIGKVVVNAVADVIHRIDVQVIGGVVEVKAASAFNTRFPIRVSVVCPKFKVVSLSAAGAIQGSQLSGQSLKLTTNAASQVDLSEIEFKSIEVSTAGATQMSLSGKASRQQVRLMGAGTYDARNLESQSVQLEVFGAPEVAVNAQKQLDVQITGAADVKYRGRPQIVQRHVIGAGSVEPDDE